MTLHYDARFAVRTLRFARRVARELGVIETVLVANSQDAEAAGRRENTGATVLRHDNVGLEFGGYQAGVQHLLGRHDLDLLAVTREFLNAAVSRSGLARCLARHGVGNLTALKPAAARASHKPFKAYAPGYVHVDVKYLPQMADQPRRSYLFVAIDRATRWVFIAVEADKTAHSAASFLKALHRACPINIERILTDNGKEFTDRLFASRERQPSGNHEFDQLCTALGIEHRLTPVRHPQTNGMVERFNGRIADILTTHHFNSAEDLQTTPHRYVELYNNQFPQSALHGLTPAQAMENWYRNQPELFQHKPDYRPGLDSGLVLGDGCGPARAP